LRQFPDDYLFLRFLYGWYWLNWLSMFQAYHWVLSGDFPMLKFTNPMNIIKKPIFHEKNAIFHHYLRITTNFAAYWSIMTRIASDFPARRQNCTTPVDYTTPRRRCSLARRPRWSASSSRQELAAKFQQRYISVWFLHI